MKKEQLTQQLHLNGVFASLLGFCSRVFPQELIVPTPFIPLLLPNVIASHPGYSGRPLPRCIWAAMTIA